MKTLVTELVKNHLTFETGAICSLFLFIELNTQSLEDFSNKLSLYEISVMLWPRELNRSADEAGQLTKDYSDKRKQGEGQKEGHLGAFRSSLKSALQKEKQCLG